MKELLPIDPKSVTVEHDPNGRYWTRFLTDGRGEFAGHKFQLVETYPTSLVGLEEAKEIASHRETETVVVVGVGLNRSESDRHGKPIYHERRIGL